MNQLLTVATTVALLGLAGCGEQSGVEDRGGPTDRSGVIAHPTGADDVVLRIDAGGGYVPVEYALTGRPTLVLTGDGRVILPQSSPAAGAGRRMLGLVVVRADEEQVQGALQAADAAGLLAEEPDYTDDAPDVTDMPSTRVVINADGQRRDHAAYALGFESETGDRLALASFVSTVTDLFADAPSSPFEARQVRLSVTSDVPASPADESVQPWSDDDIDLSTIGECTVVGATPGVVAQLAGADLSTFFGQGDHVYSVVGAAVLPGDRPCD